MHEELDRREKIPWVLFVYLELFLIAAAYGFFRFTPVALAAPKIWQQDWRGAIFAFGFGSLMTLCGIIALALMFAILVMQCKARVPSK